MKEEFKKFGVLLLIFIMCIGLCSGVEVKADSDELPTFSTQPVFDNFDLESNEFKYNHKSLSTDADYYEYLWLDYSECGHGNGYDLHNIQKIEISSEGLDTFETEFYTLPTLNCVAIYMKCSYASYEMGISHLYEYYQSGNMKVKIIFDNGLYVESDVVIDDKNYLSDSLRPNSGTYDTIITAFNYNEYLDSDSTLSDSLPKFFDKTNSKLYINVDDVEGGLSVPSNTTKIMLKNNESGETKTLYSNGGVTILDDYRYSGGMSTRFKSGDSLYDSVNKEDLPFTLIPGSTASTIEHNGFNTSLCGDYLVYNAYKKMTWREFYNEFHTAGSTLNYLYTVENNPGLFTIKINDRYLYDDIPTCLNYDYDRVVYSSDIETINTFMINHEDVDYEFTFNNRAELSDSLNYLYDSTKLATLFQYPNLLKNVTRFDFESNGFIKGNYRDFLEDNSDKFIGLSAYYYSLPTVNVFNMDYFSKVSNIDFPKMNSDGLINSKVIDGICLRDSDNLKDFYNNRGSLNLNVYSKGYNLQVDKIKNILDNDNLDKSIIHDSTGNSYSVNSLISSGVTDINGYVDLSQLSDSEVYLLVKFLTSKTNYVIYFSEDILGFSKLCKSLKDSGTLDSYYYPYLHDKYCTSGNMTIQNQDDLNNLLDKVNVDITVETNFDLSSYDYGYFTSGDFSSFRIDFDYLGCDYDGHHFNGFTNAISKSEVLTDDFLNSYYSKYCQYKDYNMTSCEDSCEYGKLSNGKFIANSKFFEEFDLGKSYDVIIQGVTGNSHDYSLDFSNSKILKTSTIRFYDDDMRTRINSGNSFNKWNDFGVISSSPLDYWKQQNLTYYEVDYATITPASAPSEPKNLKSSLDGDNIEVSWSSPDNEGLGTDSNGSAITDDVIKVDDYKISVYKENLSERTSELVNEFVRDVTTLDTEIPVSEKGVYRVLVTASNLIGTGSQATLLVDNTQTVSEPSLSKPRIINKSSAQTSITYDWVYEGELQPDSYEVAYSLSYEDDDLEWSKVSKNTLERTIEGLSPDTEYKVYVRALKGTKTSDYDSAIISTKGEDPEPTPSEDPEPSKEPEPTPSIDPEPTPSDDPEPTPSGEPTPSEEPTPSIEPSEDPEPTPIMPVSGLPKPLITRVVTTETTLKVDWEYRHLKAPNYFEVGISDESTKLPTSWEMVNSDVRDYEFRNLNKNTKYYVFVRAVFDEGVTEDDSDGVTLITGLCQNPDSSDYVRTGDYNKERAISRVLIGSVYIMAGVIIYNLVKSKKEENKNN